MNAEDFWILSGLSHKGVLNACVSYDGAFDMLRVGPGFRFRVGYKRSDEVIGYATSLDEAMRMALGAK